MPHRSLLLLYLTRAANSDRIVVGPTLAAAADRAGWTFECYYDALRRGRHSAGDMETSTRGVGSGSLMAGGRHAEQLLRLGLKYEIVAVGDADAALRPTLEAMGAEVLTCPSTPADVYGTAFARLGMPVPELAYVLDDRPQGAQRLRVGPFFYPALLREEAVGVEAGASGDQRAELEALGVREFHGLGVDGHRAARFPGGLDSNAPIDPGVDYASLTSTLAERHRAWGRGIALGDPDLIASQLPRAHRRRLLPLYGRPHVSVIASASEAIRTAERPVFARQFDDRDFFALAELGQGVQLVDPTPPFDAMSVSPVPLASCDADMLAQEPTDAQLSRWAGDNRVLSSLLFWSGMVRELDCVPSVIDLVAETGMRAGLILSADSVEQGSAHALELLTVPPDRGGVLGLLEPLLGSTGSGVAPEAYLPPEALKASLCEAMKRVRTVLPEGLWPRGWWALLDAPLLRQRHRSFFAHSEGRIVARFPHELGWRVVAGVLRRSGLRGRIEPRRPYEDMRPGRVHQDVVAAVAAAGFEYAWSKAGFGVPRIVARKSSLASLSLTAGNWDGWTPFYTSGNAADLARAEEKLLRRERPGWLVSNIDATLWSMSGEQLERGAGLYDMAQFLVNGGRSKRLINVTPHTVARYARLVHR